jgi:uncharacterized RDD family membrane protein YckC
MSEIAPGWYRDPADPNTQRYWDGEGWLGGPLPADATPPDEPPAAEPPPWKPAAQKPADTPPGTAATLLGGTAAPPGHPGADAGTAPPGQPVSPPAGQPVHPVPPPGTHGVPPGTHGVPPGTHGVPPGTHGVPPGYPVHPGPPPGTPGLPPGHPPHGQGGPYPGRPPYSGYVPVVPRPHGFALAPVGSRFVARLIDIAVVAALSVVVNAWFAYQWWQEVKPVLAAVQADPLNANPQATARGQWLVLTMLFITTALWLAYEVPALGNTGQTLGKRAMRIKVMAQESTEPLGFGRAFRRWGRLGMWTPLWGCYGVGLLFQLIGSASLLFDQPLHRAFHDRIAGTVVVEVPRVPGPAAKKNDSTTTGGAR